MKRRVFSVAFVTSLGVLGINCSSVSETPGDCGGAGAGGDSGAVSTGGAMGGVGGSTVAGAGDGGASGSKTNAGGSGGAGSTSIGGADTAGVTSGGSDAVHAGGSSDAGSPGELGFAPEHDRYGSLSIAGGQIVAPAADGNIIQMNRSMILSQFTVNISVSTDEEALFFVFAANNWDTGPLVPLWTASKSVAADPAARDEPSPELSLLLEADKTYWIGVSLPSAQSSIEHGFHGGVYFASSALVDTLSMSPIGPPIPQSISLNMMYAPSIEDPVIETLELSLPSH